MRSWSQLMVNWTAGIAFPATCAGCGVTDTWLCDHCQRQIQRIDLDRICQRCGLPSIEAVENCHRCSRWNEALDSERSAFVYGGPVRRAIHLTKYSGQHKRAEWFGIELATLINGLGWTADFMTSVPLAPARERERGYNQSAKIAESIARKIQVEYKDVVLKVRETKAQTGLSQIERFDNVSGAFEAPGDYSGKHVIVVDDVITTGATLLACATALKQSGASSVVGLTVATGMTNDDQL